jgi:hypothetical protein
MGLQKNFGVKNYVNTRNWADRVESLFRKDKATPVTGLT